MAEQEFLTHLHSLFHSLPKEGALHAFREKNWKKLLELGLPAKSHEAFRYVSLRDLYKTSFEPSLCISIQKPCFADAILPECAHSHLVFVNGCLSLHLSDISALPQQIVLLNLEDAMRSHGSFLQQHFSRSLKEENDPFALLNMGLSQNGLFFYVPPNMRVQSPVQVLYLFTGEASIVSCPRMHLVLGARSQLSCVMTSYELQPQGNHLFVPAIEITLEEEASLDLFHAVDCPKNSWILESLRAFLKRKARFHSLQFTLGAQIARHSYRVVLKGEEARADLNGLWVLKKNRTAHIHASIEHEAPSTQSMQLFKGVLTDTSQSSFEGKILVRKEAQKTEAYQLNKNLILSQGAIANSKPNLEVFADDVKASHGATVSQLDPDQLFYLSSRGIDLVMAQRLLVSGFCREIIALIPYDSLLQKILRPLEEDEKSSETFAECVT